VFFAAEHILQSTVVQAIINTRIAAIIVIHLFAVASNQEGQMFTIRIAAERIVSIQFAHVMFHLLNLINSVKFKAFDLFEF
jgi:hypothetical protein